MVRRYQGDALLLGKIKHPKKYFVVLFSYMILTEVVNNRTEAVAVRRRKKSHLVTRVSKRAGM
jgi:hypothetical protein